MALYRDFILAHYKNPQNKGELSVFTHSAKKNNPTCGDEVEMQLEIKDDVVVDVRFNGHGCAISQAACSLLTDYIKGETIESVRSLSLKDITLMLGGEQISPGRIKCATLCLETLKQAINGI